MLKKIFSGQIVTKVGIIFVGVLICVCLFYLWKLPNNSHSSLPKPNLLQTTSSQSPSTNSSVSQQAQVDFTKFLDYLKTSSSSAIKITDYKVNAIKNISQKGSEIHVVIVISVLPADYNSQYILLASGGTLQTNGWITNKMGYIILLPQKETYTTRSVGFSQLKDF